MLLVDLIRFGGLKLNGVLDEDGIEGNQAEEAATELTDEFKAGAVALVLKEKKPVATVANDLGLSTSVVHSWVKQAKADSGRGPPGAMTTSDKEELARLIKENRVLRMEREILKKAAAFFARESA